MWLREQREMKAQAKEGMCVCRVWVCEGSRAWAVMWGVSTVPPPTVYVNNKTPMDDIDSGISFRSVLGRVPSSSCLRSALHQHPPTYCPLSYFLSNLPPITCDPFTLKQLTWENNLFSSGVNGSTQVLRKYAQPNRRLYLACLVWWLTP